ncbi:unnamed protein product [Urochloa humidicola]
MSSESKKTASMCTTESDSGAHTFEITGYSLRKGMGVGRCIRSATFAVGGFDWSIRFFPDGSNEAAKDYIVAFLELMSSNTEAQASYDLRFVKQGPHLLQVPVQELRSIEVTASEKGTRLFSSCNSGTRFVAICAVRAEFDMLGGYLVNDCLKIQCDLTVVRRPRSSENGAVYVIEVPPCDMMQHFGNLLKEKKGVDVTFLVGGETIEAHKIVLAARSPVFKAEFFGHMRESGTSCVTVEDMQPEVFEALLHFIYNDSLPDMGDLEGNHMMWHLLAAAIDMRWTG